MDFFRKFSMALKSLISLSLSSKDNNQCTIKGTFEDFVGEVYKVGESKHQKPNEKSY